MSDQDMWFIAIELDYQESERAKQLAAPAPKKTANKKPTPKPKPKHPRAKSKPKLAPFPSHIPPGWRVYWASHCGYYLGMD